MQWTSILARGDLGIGGPGARERMILRDGDDRADLSVEPLDATEIDVRKSLRRELPGLDPS